MKDPNLWRKLEDAPVIIGKYPRDAKYFLPERFTYSLSEAENLIREYRRFLYLVAISKEILAPSKIVDQLWHMHLDSGQEYHDFCRKIIGKKIHHIEGRPVPNRDPAYQRTRELILQEFGVIDERIWPARTSAIWRGCFLISVAVFAGSVLLYAAHILDPIIAAALIILAGIVMWYLYAAQYHPHLISRRKDSGCGGVSGCGGYGDSSGGSDGGGGCGGGSD